MRTGSDDFGAATAQAGGAGVGVGAGRDGVRRKVGIAAVAAEESERAGVNGGGAILAAASGVGGAAAFGPEKLIVMRSAVAARGSRVASTLGRDSVKGPTGGGVIDAATGFGGSGAGIETGGGVQSAPTGCSVVSQRGGCAFAGSSTTDANGFGDSGWAGIATAPGASVAAMFGFELDAGAGAGTVACRWAAFGAGCCDDCAAGAASVPATLGL